MVKILSGPLSQQQNPNRHEPTRKPQLDLLEKDEVKAKRPSMWHVVFYNAPTPLRSPNKSNVRSC